MRDLGHLLFLQKRSLRAGAQTSLARMVRSDVLAPLQPAALVGTEGWLWEELNARSVPSALTAFPSPRAFSTRLFGYRPFVGRAVSVLAFAGIRPRAIVANDHQECSLALRLSKAFGRIPVLAILRTPGMNRADFEKYECDHCDGLMGEGEELNERLRHWTKKSPTLFEEGFCEEEFHEPIPVGGSFPDRLLVIGSEAPRKGFADFITALDKFEAQHPEFPGMQCDFTGTLPEGELAVLAARPRRSRFKFLGRVSGFAELVRQYPLVVHPSRAETFGMAPIEAILAGVPTMISRTGAAEKLGLPSVWIFEPSAPDEMTMRLSSLWQNWRSNIPDVAKIQRHIRAGYHIDHTAGFVRAALRDIGVFPALAN